MFAGILFYFIFYFNQFGNIHTLEWNRYIWKSKVYNRGPARKLSAQLWVISVWCWYIAIINVNENDTLSIISTKVHICVWSYQYMYMVACKYMFRVPSYIICFNIIFLFKTIPVQWSYLAVVYYWYVCVIGAVVLDGDIVTAAPNIHYH